MDHFEQELTRMMRDGREDAPFDDRRRYRLRAAVRARQRTRTAWMATGSVLTVAGLGIVLTVLSGSLADGGPAGPSPRPVTSAESVPAPSTARLAPTAPAETSTAGAASLRAPRGGRVQ
ncbi:hypothetical protein OG599_32850 [Streptomyces sp. NBC_01335]|uniref:hypothetical protein n=1 Tax=Streptomyces sp. NBC_01335 TaxID=2903828 RepID=UPI002E135D7E|nr:hypothetical protein OG599_32850 [Streptomyces sp. NBC_01335]